MVELFIESFIQVRSLICLRIKSFWLPPNFSGVLPLQITDNLEQTCYKDLRNEVFGSVRVVLCIYRKLLSSCKEQM